MNKSDVDLQTMLFYTYNYQAPTLSLLIEIQNWRNSLVQSKEPIKNASFKIAEREAKVMKHVRH